MTNPYPKHDQISHAIYEALTEIGPALPLLSRDQLTQILEQAVRAREADREYTMNEVWASVRKSLHGAGFDSLSTSAVTAIKRGILDPVTFRYIVLDYSEPPEV